MKKAISIFVFLFVAGVVVVWAGGMGAEFLKLNGGGMGQITVPHWKHQVALNDDCNACHKLFPQEKQVVDKLKNQGSFKKKSLMNTCIACHKDLKSQSKPAGPVNCKECHKK